MPKVSVDHFFTSQADEKADKNPSIVMVDESTGEKYAREVGKKGTGEENEMEWLVKDLSEEMKSWDIRVEMEDTSSSRVTERGRSWL